MSEQPINTNPWAEKLQQVSLPEPAAAKHQLLLLLDREMPLPPPKDNRRWVLTLLLLLLLMGVCNCPGRVSFTKTSTLYPAIPGRNSLPAKSHSPVVLNTNTTGMYTEAPPAITALHKHVKQRNSKQTKHAVTTTYGHNTETAGADDKKPAIITTNKVEGQHHPTPVVNSRPDTSNRVDTAARAAGTTPATDTVLKKPTTTDSTAKKKSKQADKKKWAFAAGINQSFPIGRRQDIQISDYIPTLQLRYHFNEKWYVQAELAIHAPQYVDGLPLWQWQRSDSAGTVIVHHSVFLEKLIYWHLPLGIYYSPFKNGYVGAGIRPGILSNAIGLYEDRVTRGYPARTVLSSKTQSIKNDTSGIYNALSAIDWQWYADINYRWKQFLAGLRYNRGTGPYINTTIPGGSPVKASNSSAQLYIRYTIWRQRHKNKLTVK